LTGFDEDPPQVCVVGLGKIGLPLAAQYASMSVAVVGADIDQRVVGAVNLGICPIGGEPGLADRIATAHRDGLLIATTDTTVAVSKSSVVVVVVPLLIDSECRPDFGALDSAVESIGAGLQRGSLVCFETTLPVGTTRDRFTPRLASLSGLTPGVDFFVCFSPERVLTGRTFADLRRYPKLVGGLEETSLERGIAFYERVLEFDERPDLDRKNGVWPMAALEAAELAKLAETTYRDVNIGLANEFAMFADTLNIDIYDVIAAANSQPYSHIHRPGIAVGGHCIPVYPELYMSTHPSAKIPRAARSANLAMPNYAVQRLRQQLGDLRGCRVVILGVAYRGGVKESAFSGARPLADALAAEGALPLAHDPLYTDEELGAMGFIPFHYFDQCEAAIIQADHTEYNELDPEMTPGIRCLIDGRRMLPPAMLAAVPVVAIGLPPTGRV
jgi:nucleotide sugar dehydrogenase